MIKINKDKNIIFKTSDNFDYMNIVKEEKERYIRYSIRGERYKFKHVILNRSIDLNNSYYYIVFDLHYCSLAIMLCDENKHDDEYTTEFNLMQNTIVSLNVEDIGYNNYVLYIDILPLDIYIKEKYKVTISKNFLDKHHVDYDENEKSCSFIPENGCEICKFSYNGDINGAASISEYEKLCIYKDDSIIKIFSKDISSISLKCFCRFLHIDLFKLDDIEYCIDLSYI